MLETSWAESPVIIQRVSEMRSCEVRKNKMKNRTVTGLQLTLGGGVLSECAGDTQLPFTCGSQARRSLIKYFFRKYTTTSENGIVGDTNSALSRNLSQLIGEKVASIFANYTDPRSLGCHDPETGTCSLAACAFRVNGYSPCMSTSFQLSESEVGDFIVSDILNALPKYYAHTLTSTAPWLTYYKLEGASADQPFQWRDNPAQAAAAQRLSHFSPASPIVSYASDEVYTMSQRDDSSSLWAMCTSLLGHAAMSLPIEVGARQRPVGARPLTDENDNLDMGDMDQVEAFVRSMTQSAMRSPSPFVWHGDRRHAPSRSSVCGGDDTQSQRHQQKPPGRLVVEPITINTGIDEELMTVRPAEGLTFPFFGYTQSRIGDAGGGLCVCATEDAGVLGRCIVSSETCASLNPMMMMASTTTTTSGGSVANDTTDCIALTTACAVGQQQPFYSRVDESENVMRCLTRYGQGVRCPELAPSDIWGLFPVGCTTQECTAAPGWITIAGGDVSLEGARFLTDGRAGLRIPNYRHVNNTYHKAVHYGQVPPKRAAASVQQPRCFDGEQLTPSAAEEDTIVDFGAEEEDAVLRRLFPATQLRFDAPVTAVCSRYIVEIARSEIIGGIARYTHTLSHTTLWV
jgi:hypothetical protein